jgi:hypothetical protein
MLCPCEMWREHNVLSKREQPYENEVRAEGHSPCLPALSASHFLSSCRHQAVSEMTFLWIFLFHQGGNLVLLVLLPLLYAKALHFYAILFPRRFVVGSANSSWKSDHSVRNASTFFFLSSVLTVVVPRILGQCVLDSIVNRYDLR